MPYVVPPPDPVNGPTIGEDRPLLIGYLRWQRATLLAICAGLTGEQLALRPLASTDLSLLGLLRHAARVERVWLRERSANEDVVPLYGGPGDPADFRDGAAGDAGDVVRQLTEEWRLGDAAVAELPWEHEVAWRGNTWSLRMVHVHLIGEYARHNGHADLLREAIDGVTER